MATFYKIEDSNEVELSLDSVPGWLTKIALPILLVLVIGLPITLHFISYPEIEVAKVKIIPSKTPFSFVNKPNYEVEEILKEEGDIIKQGMVLALGHYIETGKKDSIVAPEDGIFHMVYDLTSEKKVLIVKPSTNSYTIRGAISVENRKFLKKNQKVFINLKRFPAQEFGVLEGRVKNLSSVPYNGTFAFDIALDKGLLSTENIFLEVNEILEGEAKVFTNEKSVLVRILNSLKIP